MNSDKTTFKNAFRSHLPSKYQIQHMDETTGQLTWVWQDADRVGQSSFYGLRTKSVLAP